MGLPAAICNDVSAIILGNGIPPNYFFLGATPPEHSKNYSITTASGAVVTFRYLQFSEWTRAQITYYVSTPGHSAHTIAIQNVIQAGPAAGRRAMAAAVRQLALTSGFYVEADANNCVRTTTPSTRH